ncbi:MAG: hypothetical protein DWQ05_16325 [Calditrichaeota bacterium]|nr:MAG: hypothetical protein DWQ05_16325 [Calditrichota bacterium]
MNRVLVLLLSLIAFASPAAAQNINLSESVSLNYKGNLGIDTWYFPRKAPDAKMPESVNSLCGALDMTLVFDAPLEIRLNQRLLYDFENADRNRYEIEDLYLDYFRDNFEVRAGMQTFSWKTVESISQADFLNQTDLESDFLDADKFGELAVRTRLILPTETEQVFEIYYLARMRATRFPVDENRFSFGLNVLNDASSHQFQSAKDEWRPQIALSFQRPFFDNIDTRFFYFNGYNRFPGLLPKFNAAMEFQHQYRLVHKTGLTFQGELGAWLVKGETVHTAFQREIVNQLGERIKPDYLAYTIGFEYTFYSALIENHDIGFIAEIIGDSDAGKKSGELEGFRPFQSYLFSGLRYVFNNVSDRSLLMGSFYDYEKKDILLRIEYEERLREIFTIKIAFNDLIVESSPLDLFSHADRLILELAYNF